MQVHFNKIILFARQYQRCFLTPLALLILLFNSCNKSTLEETPQSVWEAPEWFPEMDVPDDNKFTKARWELGKKLFYDTRLSIDNSISCSSCHDPKLSFAVNEALSPGVFNRDGVRNASMLANIGYAPNLLREGGVPSLEMQVLVPIQEHNEFNHDILEIVEELAQDDEYISMTDKAYDTLFSPWVLTRALGVFERSLISGNSPFDRYNFLGMEDELSEKEKAGMDLFYSDRLNCFQCHGGVFFSTFDFANNGLKEEYEDVGRFRLTELEEDRAVFKIPSLRNIEVTGPYLHDGSISSLEEIIDLYSEGGYTHPNKSELLDGPINLSNLEKEQLLAFLKSLTDHSFLNDERWVE